MEVGREILFLILRNVIGDFFRSLRLFGFVKLVNVVLDFRRVWCLNLGLKIKSDCIFD